MPKIHEVDETVAALRQNDALIDNVASVDMDYWQHFNPIKYAIYRAVLSNHTDHTTRLCFEEQSAFKVGACLAMYAVDRSIGVSKGIDGVIGRKVRASMMLFDPIKPEDPYKTIIEDATKVNAEEVIDDHIEVGPLLQLAYDRYSHYKTRDLGDMSCRGALTVITFVDSFWTTEVDNILAGLAAESQQPALTAAS